MIRIQRNVGSDSGKTGDHSVGVARLGEKMGFRWDQAGKISAAGYRWSHQVATLNVHVAYAQCRVVRLRMSCRG